MAVIGKIRQRVGILVFVIALAMLGFILTDLFSNWRPAVNDGTVAGFANGTQLSTFEYNRRAEQAEQNTRNQFGQNATQDQLLQARQSAWTGYIDEIIAQQEYDALGIQVTSEEMVDLYFDADFAHPQMKSTATFQDDAGNFSPAKVQQYIDQFITNEELPESQRFQNENQWNNFESFVKSDRHRTKYSALIKQGLYAPEWLVQQMNEDKGKNVSVQYVQVPFTSIDDSEVSVTDADLKAYLNKHKAELQQKEASRSIDYVVFPVTPSVEDTARAKKKVEDVLAEFATTDNDTTFTRINSEDEYNGLYFTKDEMLGSPLQDTLFSAELGTVFTPYMDGQGFYRAVKLVDRKMIPDSIQARHIRIGVTTQEELIAARATLDSLKIEITENGADFEVLASQISDDSITKEKGGDLGKLSKQQWQTTFVGMIDFYNREVGDVYVTGSNSGLHLVEIVGHVSPQLGINAAVLSSQVAASTQTDNLVRAEAQRFAGLNESEDKFRAAAEENGYEIQSASGLTKANYNIQGLGANVQLNAWTFQNSTGAVCENPFDFGDKYVAVLVTGGQDEGVLQINDGNRILLESEVMKEKKAELIKGRIANAGSTLAELGTEFNVPVEDLANVGFGFGSLDNAARGAAFGLEEGQLSAPVTGTNGVYVLQVTATSPATEIADMESEKQSANQTIRVNASRATLALRNSAEIDDSRFRNFNFQ